MKIFQPHTVIYPMQKHSTCTDNIKNVNIQTDHRQYRTHTAVGLDLCPSDFRMEIVTPVLEFVERVLGSQRGQLHALTYFCLYLYCSMAMNIICLCNICSKKITQCFLCGVYMAVYMHLDFCLFCNGNMKWNL